MKHYVTGVHTLVNLLYSPQNILSNKKIPQKVVENGNVVHLKLGYVGDEVFKRYYRIGDYLFEIIGSPDKINTEEGCVEELKTYKTDRTREIQKDRGRLQLMFYSWLTGLNCAKLILYDTVNGRLETIYYRFSEEEIKDILEKALQKYIKLKEVLK